MDRLILVLSVSLATAAVVSLPDRQETALERHVGAEVRRLQAHFDSVDVELRMRDVSRLSAKQRSVRVQLAAWLREYRNAASFPLNDGLSAQQVPIFRDSRGVFCAMAYLIERSGRADIVDAVAATRNTASIYELVDDPRLVAWLDSTGLTADEAARIQPAYSPPGGERNQVDANYAVASVALSGAALVTLGVNVVRPSRISGVVGLLAGSVAMASGLMLLDEAPGTRRLAAVNTGVGAASMALALRGVFSSPRPARPAPVTAKLSNIQLAPTVALLGSPQVGFVISAQF